MRSQLDPAYHTATQAAKYYTASISPFYSFVWSFVKRSALLVTPSRHCWIRKADAIGELNNAVSYLILREMVPAK